MGIAFLYYFLPPLLGLSRCLCVNLIIHASGGAGSCYWQCFAGCHSSFCLSQQKIALAVYDLKFPDLINAIEWKRKAPYLPSHVCVDSLWEVLAEQIFFWEWAADLVAWTSGGSSGFLFCFCCGSVCCAHCCMGWIVTLAMAEVCGWDKSSQ